MKWRFELASKKGGRQEQQDRIVVLTSTDQSVCLAVLADGLGGHHNGGFAAQIVIDIAQLEIENISTRYPKDILTAICTQSHEKIVQLDQEEGLHPATTCVMLLLTGNEAYWVHVGDSRLYHYRNSQNLFCTRDHTLSELNFSHTNTTYSKFSDNPESHQLYMCLGGKNEVAPEYGDCAVDENDWFILCSDGISNMMDGSEFASVVHNDQGLQESALVIANMSVGRGGAEADNASIILAIPEKKSDVMGVYGLFGKMKSIFNA